MNFIQIIEAFFVAGFISYLITPFIRMTAIKLDYLDYPKDNKVHAHPTPLLGGVAMFIAFFIAILMKEQAVAMPQVRAILLGSFILLIVGLIDDKMGMMPNFKLFGQFLAAMVVIKSGLRVEFIPNYYLSVIFTYLWIIGITNSFNLLDNMNGLSAGIAGISALFFGIISLIDGQLVASTVSFALAGCAFGFLKHNFPKANIFMGDTGSLILGYVLASLAILGSWKSFVLTTSLMIPVLVLGYPIFDTTLVSIIRILEGRSIFQGGKDHSSHRLALLGLKRYRAVLAIYGICVCLGLSAVIVTKVYWKTGVSLGILVFISMLALGIRLSTVDTKRFGRKRGANGQVE